MDWKEITIGDKDFIDRFLARNQPEASDYTFTNLFIWHFSRQIHLAVAEDFLCIRVTYPNREPLAMMPIGTGDPAGVFERLAEDFHQRGLRFRMRAVTKETAAAVERALPGRFAFAPEPDRFDYVYSVDELVRLEGARFKPKRNHINVFKETYNYRYYPLLPDLLPDVARSEIEWCKKRDCESQEDLENEKKGILEAASHYDILCFQGGVLKVDGRTVAFTFGEPLTKDTVVIHIEKADPDIRGAYQMINQQFLENEFPHMTWVNREEDLGIEGLRKAKLSYNPARMVEKFQCELR
jgi:uncharacterized protein